MVKEWPFLCTELGQMQLHNMTSFDLRNWKPLRCSIALFVFIIFAAYRQNLETSSVKIFNTWVLNDYSEVQYDFDTQDTCS